MMFILVVSFGCRVGLFCLFGFNGWLLVEVYGCGINEVSVGDL